MPPRLTLTKDEDDLLNSLVNVSFDQALKQCGLMPKAKDYKVDYNPYIILGKQASTLLADGKNLLSHNKFDEYYNELLGNKIVTYASLNDLGDDNKEQLIKKATEIRNKFITEIEERFPSKRSNSSHVSNVKRIRRELTPA